MRPSRPFLHNYRRCFHLAFAHFLRLSRAKASCVILSHARRRRRKTYAFTEGQTVADLFAAAKAAGDIKDYQFSGSFLSSVTLADGTVLTQPSDYSSYWSCYSDGASDYNGDKCAKGSALAAGEALQFAWVDSVANYGPSKEQWDALKAKVEGADPAPAPKPEPAPEPAAINKYDAAKAETLIANLSARFASNGKDHAIDNSTFCAAVALNSLGKGASIDADAILANLKKDDLMTAGRMGKYIMALTAAGIDCTKVNDNGTVRNLVA